MIAQYWKRIDHMDPRALEMADRHYSRQSPGTPEFIPNGQKVALIHFLDDGTPAALWASHRPAPGKAVRQDGRDAWACTMFRIEHRTVPASALILEAMAITRGLWSPIPRDGFLTTIDPRKVQPIMRRGNPMWGYCYVKAGYQIAPDRTPRRDLILLTYSAAQLSELAPVEAPLSMPPFGIAWRRWPKDEPEDQAVLWSEP